MTSQIENALSTLYERIDYSLEFITPEKAQFYLEKNFENNRKISRNRICHLFQECVQFFVRIYVS